MAETSRCPKCGAELAADGPEGLCPRCLLLVGIGVQTTTGRSAAAAAVEMPTGSHFPGANPSPRSPHEDADLPEPGQRFGNYRLIRTLGKGGMGTVYEADDLESGRRVALKLLAHSLESPDARNRFFREGRLAASINHPNSVYVYGTQVIDGTPAISMEHIAGGTLRDRVWEGGPFPVTQAVDVILQIIDGLEAAARLGVLHRDVKPSNCFIGADGTVKVGDFGLSISTTARGDTHLTQPGSFLGTPAFSSPEQLRGDELNVRSDIYAVGVTLYYLLTGRVPFDSDNLVKLLATVLEQPAPSPTKYRKEIPQGLARVVLRCLAKQPADRFKNYAELRAALVPYNSTAPTPATLALRGLAGVGDQFVSAVVLVAVQIVWFSDYLTDPNLFRSTWNIAITITSVVLYIFYYAVPEGLWGASLGKALCRLRVVDRNRSLIGIPRAAARATIYVVFPQLISDAYFIISRKAPFDPQIFQSGADFWVWFLAIYSSPPMLALLFSTARRRNGYAGLHDLATGARVILRSTYVARPALAVEDQSLPDTTEKATIGPYHVLDRVHKTESEEFLLGYDARLLRRVWIHKLPADSPPVTAEQRNMGRIGRLRWINGRRSADECWDAYEALTGKPLVSLLDEPQPWSIVRYWLLDLAQELAVAEKDGTLPEVHALDRVWITAEGRAKLLDFRVPGTDTEPVTSHQWAAGSPTAPISRQFLFQVAVSALQGRAVDGTATDLGPAASRLPVDAHALLKRLLAATSAEDVLGELRPLVKRTPSVTRLRRIAMLSAMAALPLFLMMILALGRLMLSQIVDPDIAELQKCLICMNRKPSVQGAPGDRNDLLQQRSADEKREAFEIYIAGMFRDTISDQKTWNSRGPLAIPQRWRSQAERIIAERPRPSQQELQNAAAVIEPILKGTVTLASLPALKSSISFLAFLAVMAVAYWLVFVTVPSALAAIALRRGMILRAFGVDCVMRTGAAASRLRMLWRTSVFNLPVVLLILPAFRKPVVQDLTTALLPVVGLLVALVIWSSLLRERGLADRLSGTYPVPR